MSVMTVKGFYRQFQGEVIIRIEACGYTNWFEELMEQLPVKSAVVKACQPLIAFPVSLTLPRRGAGAAEVFVAMRLRFNQKVHPA